MIPMHVRLNVALAGVLLSTAIVSAQQPVRVEGPRAAKSAAQLVSRDVRTSIHGIALDGDRKPLRDARIRLRNLEVNAIERTATSNTRGEFSFPARPETRYVVEIADASGRVLAAGNVVTAQAGESAGTLVMLTSGLPASGGIFNETAAMVITAATGIGLTVVDPTLPKVSPTR
jgi:hypothetical protein